MQQAAETDQELTLHTAVMPRVTGQCSVLFSVRADVTEDKTAKLLFSVRNPRPKSNPNPNTNPNYNSSFNLKPK